MAKARFAGIERLKVTPPDGRHRGTWFDCLKAEQQEELLEFKRLYHAHEFPGRSMEACYRFWRDEYGLTIRRQAFIHWLQATPDGQGDG